jgi:hypothetical protein
MVKIKMDIFVKKYQPEIYDLWIMGLENKPHPEDHHQTIRQRSNSNTNDHNYADNSNDCQVGIKRLPSSDSLNFKRKMTFKSELNMIKESESKKTIKFSNYLNSLSFLSMRPIEINNRKISIKQIYFDLIWYEKSDALQRLSMCGDNEIYKEIRDLKLPNILINSILLLNEKKKGTLKQLTRDTVFSLLSQNKMNIIQEFQSNDKNNIVSDDDHIATTTTDDDNDDDDEFILTRLIKKEIDQDDKMEFENEPQKAQYQTANDVINLKCQNSLNEFLNKEKNRNYSKLDGLWNFQEANIDKIREWNLSQSSNYPHCSICLLFKYNNNNNNNKQNAYLMDDDDASESSSNNELAKSNSDLCISSILNESENKLKLKITKTSPKVSSNKILPKNSEVLIPEMCFTKHSKARSKLPDFQRDKIDCLLQCKNCNLTVHQSCYFGFIDESLINKSAWQCNVCLSKAFDEAYCCLCLLRGGALKRTTDKKKWVHLTCTVCIDEITIKEPSSRLLVQIPKKLFNDKKNQVKIDSL